ncbi:MAG: phosphate ABC transporter permease subunit PstC [Cytophagales bacterium]
MEFKKIKEKFVESLIYISGTFTTLAVLFIVFFLFKEGSGIFKKTALEEGYSLAVNRYNPITKLSPLQIKGIIEGDIHNWKQVGGNQDSVYIFTLSDIESKFTEEELGSEFENLNIKISEYIETNTGVLAFFPSKYLDSSLVKVDVDQITLASMLKGKDWYPTANPAAQLGILPIILGSLLVSFGAIIIALPLGLIVALYLAEIAGENLKNSIKTVIELLAGIPSVVYGFFGLVVLVPLVQQTFNIPVGETALSGSILLALIALPTIISLSEDSISSTPQELKNASLALGANRLQTIFGVTLPFASSGIISASILGVGRAFGETMAVLMVTGNAAIMPTTFLEPVRTITATIAAELGEAPTGGIHYEALFILGSILFLFTFLMNLIAEFFSPKK